jgi:hypothetical protein
LRGDLQEQESIGLYFQLGAVFFCFCFIFIPKKIAKFNPKKRKKSQISIGRTNYKILPISVSKDSEISPGKKNTGWVQYFLFSQFYYLA